MRRLGPPAAGIAGVGLFMVVAAGAEGGVGASLAALLLLGGLIWFGSGWLRRRRPAVVDGWRPAEAVAYRPAGPHEPSAPRAVATALGRVEARELSSSGSFGVGLGFCVMFVILLGEVWGSDFDGEPLSIPELFPIYVHPLAGLVVLATFRARTRSTRDGTQELFDACPADQGTRTAGHLLTAWVPVVAAIVYLGVLSVLMANNLSVRYGTIGPRQLALPVGAAVLCIGATFLGVALARWAPWAPVPVVVVVLIGIASIQLATAGDRTTEPLRQLSTWLNDPELALRFTAPHWAAHHLWILALVGLVAVLALARDVHRPWVPALLAGFATVAVVSAVVATRPIDPADAQRIASLIEQPAAHQRCVDAGELAVCSYASAEALATHLADVVEPVATSTPPGALAGWTIRQGTDVNLAQLDPAVRRRLDTDPSDARVIPVPMSGHRWADEGARLWVALTAVGVTDDRGFGRVADLQGQSRGVVALWLAAQGAPADQAAEMTAYYPGAAADDGRYVRPWPDTCYAGPPPAQWALSDLDAARRLLAQPAGEIAALMRTDWDHLTDPDTTTDELLAAAGLEPVADRPGHTRPVDQC